MTSLLSEHINSMALGIIENRPFHTRSPRGLIQEVGPLFRRGDDIRVHDDSFKNLIVSLRSQQGASRPDDDEPEDQWVWDKLTDLGIRLFGAEVWDE